LFGDTRTPRRILISGYYGYANPGDEAILSVLRAQLRARWPAASLSVISGTPEQTAQDHDVEAILWSDPSAIAHAVRSADLIVTGGGGIFHDYGGFSDEGLFTEGNWGLGFHVTAGAFAALFGKPLVIYAVGVGPLASETGRAWTRAICEAAIAISVRDEASYRLLEQIGVPPGRVQVTADPAFLFEPAPPARAREILRGEGVPLEVGCRPRIGIALRHWSYGVDPEQWERAVAAGLDLYRRHTGSQLVFIPFQHFPGEQEDDVAVARRIRSYLADESDSHILEGSYTPAEKAVLLASCNAVIAMRLHALIFSLRAGVPVVSLTYDEKVRQVAARAGRAHTSLEMTAISAARIDDTLRETIAAGPAAVAPLIEAAHGNDEVLRFDAPRPIGQAPLELVRSGTLALLAAQKQLRHWVRDQKVNYEYQIDVKSKEAAQQLDNELRRWEDERATFQARIEYLDHEKAEYAARVSALESDKRGLESDKRELEADKRELEAEVTAQAVHLAEVEQSHQQTTAEWEAYADEIQRRLSLYRTQRVWRVMLALRKAYVLLVRQGWRGRLRFFPWLLSLLGGQSNLETEQLEFPVRPRKQP